jgi:glutaredoxin 3
VKEYLSQKNVAYTEYNVAADADAAKKMIEKTGHMVVPVVVIDDKDVLIGFNPARMDALLSPEKSP